MDYREVGHRLPRGVVAASEALEHLEARGGRREREQAGDLLGRELAQIRAAWTADADADADDGRRVGAPRCASPRRSRRLMSSRERAG